MRRVGEHERPRDESERSDAQRERADPGPAADLLALQRTAGNRAVGALLARDTKTKDKPKEAAPVTGNRVVFPGVGTIPVESIQFGSGGGHGPGGPGHHETREIAVTSFQGAHSSDLFRASLEGRAADVDVILQGTGGTMVIKLKGAMVTNYTVGGGEPPMESWTLDFNAIKFEREGDKKQSDDAGAGSDAYPGS